MRNNISKSCISAFLSIVSLIVTFLFNPYHLYAEERPLTNKEKNLQKKKPTVLGEEGFGIYEGQDSVIDEIKSLMGVETAKDKREKAAAEKAAAEKAAAEKALQDRIEAEKARAVKEALEKVEAENTMNEKAALDNNDAENADTVKPTQVQDDTEQNNDDGNVQTKKSIKIQLPQ